MRRRDPSWIACFIIISMFLSGCGGKNYQELQQKPDLVVYTPLTADIYEPIITEYQERTGLWVQVNPESEEDIIEEIKISRENFQGDIVLGISEATAEEYQQLFPEEYDFISSSYVIIYNTNLVIYNEIPDSFLSLLDSKWQGKIGFLDPDRSSIAKDILEFIQKQSDLVDPLDLEPFYANMKDHYAKSLTEIKTGVCDGKYAIGIVTEREARQLIADGEDIYFSNLAKEDCKITNLTATTLNSEREEAADHFLDYIASEDVHRYLMEYLKCQSEEYKGGEKQ